MTIQDFNKQPLDIRSNILFEWGFFISSHREGSFNNVLFAINGFFALQKISLEDNTTVLIRTFTRKDLTRDQINEIRTQRAFLLLAHEIPALDDGMTAAA